jgi:hypothetical protein
MRFLLLTCIALSFLSVTGFTIQNNISYASAIDNNTNMTTIDRLHFGQTASSEIINGTLGIGTANIPIQYAKQSGQNILQGDIVLNNVTANGKAAIDKFILSKPWTDGIIPYKIDPTIPNSSRIIAALEYWMSKTPIQFIQITDQNAKNYPNHIFYKYDPAECKSNIGMVGGEQIIYIANWCKQDAVIHESGHAVGLWHEMNRCDREQYVQIMEKNIKRGIDISNFKSTCFQNPIAETFNVASPKSFGPYDYCSITHYGRYAGSGNGQPTIIPTHPVVGCKDIGLVTTLSPEDIQAVHYLYPNLDWSGK